MPEPVQTKARPAVAEVGDETLLPLEPPPLFPRLTAWLVIAVVGALFLAAVLIRIPETVRCRFTLVPESGADPIQAPLAGVLDRVTAAEGVEVAEGAELFRIRSDEVITWQAQLQTAREDVRSTTERAARAEEAHTAMLRIKDAELEQVRRDEEFREQYRKTIAGFRDASLRLRDDKLISTAEYQRAELEAAAAEKDLQVARQSGRKVELERQQIETERTRQRSEEQALLAKLRVTIASLERRLADADGDIIRIRAPYRAVVVSVSQRNRGSVVRAAQELCQLARPDNQPVARLTLPQAGLDRVAAGHQARLYFDSFPYQRYGTIKARVDWVSPAAVAVGEERRFQARADLATRTFARSRLEPAGADATVAVRVGMSGEARIRVGSSPLIGYVFEPLRGLFEQTR